MKVKTLHFLVGNALTLTELYGNPTDKAWMKECKEKISVSSPEEIDRALNKFIKDKDVVDIKVNEIAVDRHNNGYSDTIRRTYTVMYNEKKEDKE